MSYKSPGKTVCLIAMCAQLSLFHLVTLPEAASAQAENYQKEKTAYDACQKANQLLAASDYEQVKTVLAPAAALDPTSYSGYLHRQLSNAYRGLKQNQSAIEEAKKAAKFDPKYDRSAYDIAMLYNEDGNIEKAVEYLEQAKRTCSDPLVKNDAIKQLSQLGAYGNLKAATKYVESGKLTQAKTLLNKAAAYDPSPYSGDIHSNLAYVYRSLGQPDMAIKEGKTALKFDPNEKTTVYTIGLAYQDNGEFSDAISWLKRYVEMETSARERQQAQNFIQELSDDRCKLDPGVNNTPDYLQQLKKQGDIVNWPKEKMPLRVFIKPASGVRGYKPVFDSYVTRSFDTWCQVCPKLSYKLVSEAKDADIKIIWTDKPLSLEESGRTRQKAGLTDVENNDKCEITKARVRIRTLNPFNSESPVREGECASVTMHEIGHSLGLGHSTGVSDIMYFGSSSKQTGLPSGRDKATLAKIYQALPVAVVASATRPSTGPGAQTGISAGAKIDFLPPPAFLPPKPPDTRDLRPPIFMPPPLPKESQKLLPPTFVPPPLQRSPQTEKKSPPAQAPIANPSSVPFFTPPPKR